MIKKDPILYVIHILEKIERIESYIGDDSQIFFENNAIYDAVLRNLQTMSEATKHLNKKCYENNQHIEWNKISGFRNIFSS